jgi:HD superfamily phosphohydrolase YqeK
MSGLDIILYVADKSAPQVVAELRCCADEKPAARIVDLG